MANILPFTGFRYAAEKGADLSNLIAPPYDVLDDAGKAALQAKDPHNIVAIDLPHLPAKSVGPDETYTRANQTLQGWLKAGVLKRDPRRAFYAYAQTYTHGERTFHRRGLFALVKLSPFGEGHVIPHEKTYPDAIFDRLKLTRATKMQLSPIFGLFSDPTNEITGMLFQNLAQPDATATLAGVRSDLWAVTDNALINAIIDRMGARPIYIADGHHRYTMALQYQKEAAQRAGGKLAPTDPANYAMFVLIGMQDEGLVIWPTHRLIGNVPSFNMDAMKSALAGVADVTPVDVPESELARYIDVTLPRQPAHTFGLFDGRTRRTWQITFRDEDVLAKLEPEHSANWRKLDVAVLQRYLLDAIVAPTFGAGGEPTRGYTAESNSVAATTDGRKYQFALLLKSTPLTALEELGKTNEVMPPKSTYFYPKLATGMLINPLE